MNAPTPPLRPSPQPFEGLLAGAFSFLILTPTLWLLIYTALYNVVLGRNATLPPIESCLSSIQYLLHFFGCQLPHHQIAHVWPGWPNWMDILLQLRKFPEAILAIEVSTWMSLLVAVALAAVIGLEAAEAPAAEIHIKGVQFTNNPTVLARSLQEPTDGVALHPEVRLSKSREVMPLLLVGKPGSGKSTILKSILASIAARGDRRLIYDHKGDFTCTEFNPKTTYLLAPWDKRGAAWAVGRDVSTMADATELSNALIEEAHDPMWSNAARMVLTAFICECIARHGKKWTFHDLAHLLRNIHNFAQALVAQHVPAAQVIVNNLSTKTGQSVLVTLAAYMHPVFALANAWDGTDADAGFSVRDWLNGKGLPNVILQGNASMASLQTALHGSIFRITMQTIGSPNFSNSDTRRAWLFLDEFLQLGAHPQLVNMLQTARSKGIAMILSMQDIEQFEPLYRQHATQSVFTGTLGTIVVCQTLSPDTAQWASTTVGDHWIKRWTCSVSNNGMNQAQSVTVQYQDLKEPLLPSGYFTQLLGPFRNGRALRIRALLITGGTHVAQLDWPITDTPKICPAHIPAPWINQLLQPANLNTVTHPSEHKTTNGDPDIPPDDSPRRVIVRKRDAC